MFMFGGGQGGYYTQRPSRQDLANRFEYERRVRAQMHKEKVRM